MLALVLLANAMGGLAVAELAGQLVEIDRLQRVLGDGRHVAELAVLIDARQFDVVAARLVSALGIGLVACLLAGVPWRLPLARWQVESVLSRLRRILVSRSWLAPGVCMLLESLVMATSKTAIKQLSLVANRLRCSVEPRELGSLGVLFWSASIVYLSVLREAPVAPSGVANLNTR
jgi:hypothetical protein